MNNVITLRERTRAMRRASLNEQYDDTRQEMLIHFVELDRLQGRLNMIEAALRVLDGQPPTMVQYPADVEA